MITPLAAVSNSARVFHPVFVARGEGDLLYVLCRASEYRPEGTRITVCTVDEEYVTAFARCARPGTTRI